MTPANRPPCPPRADVRLGLDGLVGAGRVFGEGIAGGGVGATVVVLRQVVDRLDLPREETAPERAVGDEADAEFANRRKDVVLGSRDQSE